jgi:hypothetical protein
METSPSQHKIYGNSAHAMLNQGSGVIEGLHSPNSTCSQRTWLIPFGAAGQDVLLRNDSVQGGQVAAAFSAARLGSAAVNVLQAHPSASLADKVLAKQPHVLVSGSPQVPDVQGGSVQGQVLSELLVGRNVRRNQLCACIELSTGTSNPVVACKCCCSAAQVGLPHCTVLLLDLSSSTTLTADLRSCCFIQ